MFFITGDTHGKLTRIKNFSSKMNLTNEDVIIILGDVGINYYGTHQEKSAKYKYNKYGPTIFCIQGNHESRPENFPSYKTKKWNNGIVYFEEEFPNILFAKDGEIYNFNGKECLVLGGAYSVDKWYRIVKTFSLYKPLINFEVSEDDYENILLFLQGKHNDEDYHLRNLILEMYKHLPPKTCFWFEDEQPSETSKRFAEQQIFSRNIDIILSHTCPQKYIPTEMFLSGINQSSVDNSTEKWLDQIEENTNYEKWFCGHWHTNKKIDKMIFLFEDFAEL